MFPFPAQTSILVSLTPDYLWTTPQHLSTTGKEHVRTPT